MGVLLWSISRSQASFYRSADQTAYHQVCHTGDISIQWCMCVCAYVYLSYVCVRVTGSILCVKKYVCIWVWEVNVYPCTYVSLPLIPVLRILFGANFASRFGHHLAHYASKHTLTYARTRQCSQSARQTGRLIKCHRYINTHTHKENRTKRMQNSDDNI